MEPVNIISGFPYNIIIYAIDILLYMQDDSYIDSQW